MKRYFYIILLTVFPVCGLWAQTDNPFASGMRSTAPQMMQSGSSYTPQVTPPGAMNAPIISSYGGVSERRNVDINEGDFEQLPEMNQSNESPIGEPMILIGFAAMVAGMVAFRRRNAALKH